MSLSRRGFVQMTSVILGAASCGFAEYAIASETTLYTEYEPLICDNIKTTFYKVQEELAKNEGIYFDTMDSLRDFAQAHWM